MLTLVTAQVCPFAHRARLALAAKGIEHERIEIDLRKMPAWFLEQSPNQSVPLLIHDDRKIWESIAVVHYVDEAFEGPPLLPGEPYERALARVGMETASSKFISLFWNLVLGKVENPAEKLQEIWAALQATMATEGPFWAGQHLSLADIAVYPWFERWPAVEQFSPDHQQMNLPPRLRRWLEAVQEHPAMRQERADPQLYLDAFKEYTKV
jgi:glutathione S-transferase